MSKLLVWNERYNIGVDLIDKEHKKLFSILNRMFKYKDQEDKKQWVCQEGIKYFKEHAMKHFIDEEVYMASIGYTGFESHRHLHDDFRKRTLPALEEELKIARYSTNSVNHFLGVCAGWLFGHTLTEDRAITGKTVSQWLNLLPEEQQSEIKELVLKLLNDLFQLKPKVLSDCYGGEKFGKGIYYRIVYAANKEEPWEILLVFEEKLLVNVMNNIVGMKSDTLNAMLVNSTRYIAQQFVNCIGEHFITSGFYEIQEENLLTYDQFKRTFHQTKPQVSFLFDTGEGYFAFCIMAPHLLQKELETSLQTKNAVTEIERYLKNRETVQKKKILIVDDAKTVRLVMENLLSKDYEILQAESGLSAIRSIIVNRPDLVLLDYEMPVCDGSQVLEMIRSEEDFADIPVIFLTSRVDKKSVHKVLSLKPTGYLLKTLPPTKIKKEIDDYFKKK